VQSIPCAWTADEPIRDLALHADWDSVTSMVEALRIYWFDYGTIPSWNFLFCGGRPELSVPFSWAYTWPSLFAYVFESNHAIIAVWLGMTLVGFFAMQSLLLRWTGGGLGAGVGAGIYVLSGVFVMALNHGHVPWAFFHFVPLLMLLFEMSIEPHKPDRQKHLVFMTVGSFLFFTSGLPHALIYFYPVFVVLIAFRFCRALIQESLSRACSVVGTPVVAHLLGLWLSMYKLWPAIRWQIDYPRSGIVLETRSIESVLVKMLTRYTSTGSDTISLLGALVWLAALFAVYRVVRDWRSKAPEAVESRLLIVWLVLPALLGGIVLALGNANPLLPGYWFRELPVLNGVRGFSRFLILTIFGLSVLTAFGLSWIGKSPALGRFQSAIAAGLAIATLAPTIGNAILETLDLPAHSIAQIHRMYRVPESPQPKEMLVITPRGFSWGAKRPRADHAVATLRRGYWVANCRSDIALPHIYVSHDRRTTGLPAATKWTLHPPGTRVPISNPAPERIAELTHNQISLEYDPDYEGWISLNLSVMDSFTFNVAKSYWGQARLRFKASALPEHRLIMTAETPGPREGLLASAAGLLGTGVFFWRLARRRVV
jgi:hypothetical protein